MEMEMQVNRFFVFVTASLIALGASSLAYAGSYDSLISNHAAAEGLPVSLIQEVMHRESRGNAQAVSRDGAIGLMQIKLGTARSLGYTGNAAGLKDPDTNLRYAVKYLAGAYRAAGGNGARAWALYRSGYSSNGKRYVRHQRAVRHYAKR
jgi:soluble lytic murein transglycosylase-like protein